MSSKFTVRLAEKNIGIEALYDSSKDYCRDYLTDEEADFSIKISENDIEFERIKSRDENIKEGLPIYNYKDEYLETLAIYRKIAEKMTDYDTVLFHGSVIAVDGEGFLFTAKSGTGKSTHTRLWREVFGERAVMVNDDKPLMKIGDGEITVYGTPWDGKHRISSNISVKLKGLCILERSQLNTIKQIQKSEAFDMIMQQVYKPKTPEKLIKTIQLAGKIGDNTRLYRLGCNMDKEAAEVAYNGMRG